MKREGNNAMSKKNDEKMPPLPPPLYKMNRAVFAKSSSLLLTFPFSLPYHFFVFDDRAAAYNMLKKLESEAAKLEEQDAGDDFEANSAVESSYLAMLKVSYGKLYVSCQESD